MNAATVVSTFPLSSRSRVRLEAHFEVIANASPAPWPRARLREELRQAVALIAFMPDRIDASLLEDAPHLRLISCALKGTDNFDAGACERRGIALTRVDHLLTAPTAELAIGLAISSARHIVSADAHVRSGAFTGWRPTFYGTSFADSRVGIIGFGEIGRAIALRLRGWSASMCYWDAVRAAPEIERSHEAAFAECDAVLATSDFIFVALPLTPQTTSLVDRTRIALMKSSAVLVNVARGSLVDEAAIAEALAQGRLGAYAADVFAFEDWALDARPAHIDPGLLRQRDRTVLTPHLGSAVGSVRAAIEDRAVTNVLDHFGLR